MSNYLCLNFFLKAYVPDDFHVENFQTQIETRCPFIENTPEINVRNPFLSQFDSVDGG